VQAQTNFKSTLEHPTPGMHLKSENTLKPVPSTRVILTCCKGRVINFLGDDTTTEVTNKSHFSSQAHLQEKWKVDFFKCIDASPLLAQFEG
jgi:hypothetical protein